jgi:organic radical activating enzyme
LEQLKNNLILTSYPSQGNSPFHFIEKNLDVASSKDKDSEITTDNKNVDKKTLEKKKKTNNNESNRKKNNVKNNKKDKVIQSDESEEEVIIEENLSTKNTTNTLNPENDIVIKIQEEEFDDVNKS